MWRDRDIDSDAPAVIQYTSGTIGTAKGVVLSHRSVLASMEGMADSIIGPMVDVAEPRCANWVPLSHSMGLSILLMSFFVGGRVALMAPETFVASPVRWLEAITRERAQWTGGPNFAYELCAGRITAEQRKTLDLSSMRSASNGAEPVRWSAIERFGSTFAEAGFD